MDEQFSIAGKATVITGAGDVLSSSIAKCFMQQGVKVVIVDIRQEQLDKRVEELKACGGDVVGIVGNVLDIASLEKLVDNTVTKWERIDILFDIAGGNMPGAILAPDQRFYNMDISCWEKVTNLNMNGTIYPSLVFNKVMAKQGKGCIVNISSMAAYGVIMRIPGYSTAKAAAASFTQWLVSELILKHGDGIHVNTITPGFFIDDQNRTILTSPGGSLTDHSKKVLAKTSMKRFGDIDELNNAIQFSYNNATSFITGALLPVDDGLSAFSGV